MATFDCYGTLIDWEGGVGSFLYELARRHERDPPPARELRERWEALQFERIQARLALATARCWPDSLADWAGERGYRFNEHDGEQLARSMESWQPFPDTVPALRAAREAGLRLWIISNTDRAIMEHSLRHLEVEFDGVTVAEDCRAYKPSTIPFEQALREIDVPREQILHVAFGFKYDIGAGPAAGPADRVGEPQAGGRRRARSGPTTSGTTCGRWRGSPSRRS